ncbi:serine/threonine-protein kinase M1 [Borealophlyctis nickersoniae]|nr:serine/threonine-protein kinase M1 [Borealophlyctis nickersoniae]
MSGTTDNWTAAAPLPEAELRLLTGTVTLLREALEHPAIFISPISTEVGNPASTSVRFNVGSPESARSEGVQEAHPPFDIWILVRVMAAFSIPEYDDIHNGLVGIVCGLLDLMRERPQRYGDVVSVLLKFTQDLGNLSLQNGSQAEYPLYIPINFMDFNRSIIEVGHEAKVPELPDSFDYTIVVSTELGAVTLRSYLYKVLRDVLGHPGYLVQESIHSLWTLVLDDLQDLQIGCPTIQIQKALIETYCKTLAPPRFVDAGIALSLIQYSTIPELRPVISKCFGCCSERQNDAAKPPVGTLKRKAEHGQPPSHLQAKARDTKRVRFSENNLANINAAGRAERPVSEHTKVLIKETIRMMDETTAARQAVPDDVIHVLSGLRAILEPYDSFPLNELLPSFTRLCSGVAEDTYRHVLSNCPMSNVMSSNWCKLTGILCDFSFLCAASIGDSDLTSMLLWVASIPWLAPNARNATNVPEFPFEGAEGRKAFAEFTVDLGLESLRAGASASATPRVPNCGDFVGIVVDEECAMKCLRTLANNFRDDVNAKFTSFAQWLTYVLLDATGKHYGSRLRVLAWELMPKFMLRLKKFDGLVDRVIANLQLDPTDLCEVKLVAARTLGRIGCARSKCFAEDPGRGIICACDAHFDVGSLMTPLPHENPAVASSFAGSLGHLFAHGRTEDLDFRKPLAGRALENIVNGNLFVRRAVGSLLPVFFCKRPSDDIASVISSNRALVGEKLSYLRDSGVPGHPDTLVAAIGCLARVPDDPALLEHLLLYLVEILIGGNVVMQSYGAEQIIAIAKIRHKTPLQLFMPFLSRISVYLIDFIQKKQMEIRDIASLLGITIKDFLERSLEYTIPYLVEKKRIDALSVVAELVNRDVFAMLVGQAGHIMTHLLTSDEPDAGGVYFLKTMSALSGLPATEVLKTNGVFELAPLVIVTKLTVELGNESTIMRQKAMEALRVTKSELEDSKGKSQLSLPAFLNKYLLGILSYINESIVDTGEKMTTKEKIKSVEGLKQLIIVIGEDIEKFKPQIMAALQTMLEVPVLRDAALGAWSVFVRTLNIVDVGPILGQIAAILSCFYQDFTPRQLTVALEIFGYLYMDKGAELASHISDICLLPESPECERLNSVIKELCGQRTLATRIEHLLKNVPHDNVTVCRRALLELRLLMQLNQETFHAMILAESVDAIVHQTLRVLLETCRKHNGTGVDIQILCCECIGILGAPDPARLDMPLRTDGSANQLAMLSWDDFDSFEEAVNFVCDLIERHLAPAFLSAHSTKMQDRLAFSIQELLKFCGFPPEIADETPFENREDLVKLRQRWAGFSQPVISIIRPLLKTKYMVNEGPSRSLAYPIYPQKMNFRDWIQSWTTDLISKARGLHAEKVFGICKSVVKEGVASVTYWLLPHLVLNILISGEESQRNEVAQEFLAVLEDSCVTQGSESEEKRQLSSQTIFLLVDHLTKWLRLRRQKASRQKAALAKRQGRFVNIDDPDTENDTAATHVEQLLGSIPQAAMAEASYRCKAFARALLHFEQHIRNERASGKDALAMNLLYAHLQKIYSHLDEPDGMEGISTLFVAPTLEQQILEHESAGRWTAAQTCYEVCLQQNPEKLDNQLGLLNCLKNLGHFGHEPRFEVSLGKLLLAARNRDETEFGTVVRQMRENLTAPLSAASMESYRRGYDYAVKLHMLHETENVFSMGSAGSVDLDGLLKRWESRLKITMPSFKIREPILNLRRILIHDMGIVRTSDGGSGHAAHAIECGRIWLQTAKASRKAGHFQPAHSAILHAAELQAPRVHLERAKWLWEQGHSHKAMEELRNFLEDSGKERLLYGAGTPGTEKEDIFLKAKANLMLTRWTEETSRGQPNTIISSYSAVTKDFPEWEKGHFYLGRYYSKLYDSEKQKLKQEKRISSRSAIAWISYGNSVCRCYAKALQHGTRYIFQTLPRLLTIWLDIGQDLADAREPTDGTADDCVTKFNAMTKTVRRLNDKLPAWQFLTAIPQLISRICHKNALVHQVLETIIVRVLAAYPKQTLWHLMSVSKSTYKVRAHRVAAVFARIKSDPTAKQLDRNLYTLIQEAQKLTDNLLLLCNHQVGPRENALSIKKSFRNLERMVPLRMIVPLQSTMTVTLPADGQSSSDHRPFPRDSPTIHGFHDEVEIMHSLQRPRKITVQGSDGRDYIFLCKPKDDLRKDCRLMEFNAMINKLLKKDPEARKRGLHIRTYAVIPLNEECGLIEWVPNTVGFRHILTKAYKAKGCAVSYTEIKKLMELKEPSQEEIFTTKIVPMHPPVFREWFLETFPEPTQWFASRLGYSSTTSVMSMVGYVVGLGDRHGENILFDEQTGDCVHVDLNCLFEKGLTFEKPEKVPFRLTHNMVDAFGVTGVKGKQRSVVSVFISNKSPTALITGVFHKSCEVSLRVLRNSRETLMSVLETFLYDPLCEWSKPPRQGSNAQGAPPAVATGEQENQQAVKSLETINRKLQGYFDRFNLPLSIEGQAQELIDQATDPKNLSQMYIGKRQSKPTRSTQALL